MEVSLGTAQTEEALAGHITRALAADRATANEVGQDFPGIQRAINAADQCGDGCRGAFEWRGICSHSSSTPLTMSCGLEPQRASIRTTWPRALRAGSLSDEWREPARRSPIRARSAALMACRPCDGRAAGPPPDASRLGGLLRSPFGYR